MINLMLVGDSISLDYGPYVERYLADDVNVICKEGRKEAYRDLDSPVGGNGGDSSMVLSYVRETEDTLLGDCQLFFFNCGLHDIKRSGQEEQLKIPPDEYEKNLEEIVRIVRSRGVEPVFITSTPTERSRYPEGWGFWRRNEDVENYNSIAARVMENNNVTVIDLYEFTCALGLNGDDLYRDHTHFTEAVIQLQAAYIAGAVNMALCVQPEIKSTNGGWSK